MTSLASSSQPQPWAVVLAGGAGVRLRPLVRRILGDERPKQFVPLLGRRTLLGQTLDRVGLTIPPRRTVVVTMAHHARFVEDERLAAGGYGVVAQPADRGTAAGILLPLHYVAQRDPEATVAVIPSDHFILEGEAFMDHVTSVAGWIERHPERIVLVGARPTDLEVEYGWIEPGAAEEGAGVPIRAVRGFWEKPPLAAARACHARGCLWNTFVMVARAATLIEAACAAVPELRAFTPTTMDPADLQRVYARVPAVDFSRQVLASGLPSLAVSTLPPMTWSDLGSPPRVFDLARRLDLQPDWLAAEAHP